MRDIFQLIKLASPPSAVIHVGVGAGVGVLNTWRDWSVPYALLIDADPDRIQWAKELREKHPNWTAISATLSSDSVEREYFYASNPSADGLLEPEVFNHIWPNLRTASVKLKPTIALSELLAPDDYNQLREAADLWLIIECTPALEILHGAQKIIDQCSVVFSKVVLDQTGNVFGNSRLAEISQFMLTRGFDCVQIIEGLHPNIGDAVYIRRDFSETASVPEVQAELRQLVERYKIIDDVRETDENCSAQGNDEELHQVIIPEEQASLDAISPDGSELKNDVSLSVNRTRSNVTSTGVEECNELLSGREELFSLISERDSRVRSLEVQLAELESLFNSQQNQRRTLQEKILSLQVQNDEQSLIIQNLQSERIAINADLLRKNEEFARVNAELIEQTESHRAKERQLEILEDKLCSVESRLGREESLSGELNKKTVILENENTALLKECQRIAAENAANIRHRDELNSEKNALSLEYQSTCIVLDELKKQLKAREDESALLLNKARVLESQCDVMDGKYKYLQIERGFLVDELAYEISNKETLRGHLSDLSREKLSLDSQYAVLMKAYEEVNERRKSLVADNAVLTERCNLLHQERSTLLENSQKMTADQADLIRSHDEKRNALTSCLNEVAELKLKVSQVEMISEQRLREVNERETQLQLMKNEMYKAEAQLEFIKDMLFREQEL